MIVGIKGWLVADGTTNAIIAGRVYPNKVPLDGAVPAVSYQLIDGAPENYLAENPGIDNGVYQINCWAEDMTTVNALANAARDVLQQHGQIIRYIVMDFDEETKWQGVRFVVSIWDSR
jgi:hypothetical protein